MRTVDWGRSACGGSREADDEGQERGRERAGCDTLSELWAERGCIGMPGGAARATRHPRPRAKTLKTSYFSQRTWDVGRLEWETRTHRADVHELAGANIVGADDERTGVVIEERAELVVVRLLGLESRSGRHLC